MRFFLLHPVSTRGKSTATQHKTHNRDICAAQPHRQCDMNQANLETQKTCGVPTRSQAHAAFADAQI